MCFKLELQPVNHGDYALPRCVLCGSGGISTPSGDRVCQDWGRQHRPRCCSWATIPVPEPPVPAEHHLQPRWVPALVCPSPRVSQPCVLPILGWLSCAGQSSFVLMCRCKHTQNHPKKQGAKHAGGEDLLPKTVLCHCDSIGPSGCLCFQTGFS